MTQRKESYLIISIWLKKCFGIKGPFPTLMQHGHLFLFWNRSIVKWCTLIGYLSLSACVFVRKFIAHSKLRAVFSLCHIALVRDKGTHHDEFDGGLPELSKQWDMQHAKQSTDLRISSYIWIMWCHNDQRRNKPIHRARSDSCKKH